MFGHNHGSSSPRKPKKVARLGMLYHLNGTILLTAFNEELTDLVNMMFIDVEGCERRTTDENIEYLAGMLKLVQSPDYRSEIEKLAYVGGTNEPNFFRKLVDGGTFGYFLKGVERMIEQKLFDIIDEDYHRQFD